MNGNCPEVAGNPPTMRDDGDASHPEIFHLAQENETLIYKFDLPVAPRISTNKLKKVKNTIFGQSFKQSTNELFIKLKTKQMSVLYNFCKHYESRLDLFL